MAGATETSPAGANNFRSAMQLDRCARRPAGSSSGRSPTAIGWGARRATPAWRRSGASRCGSWASTIIPCAGAWATRCLQTQRPDGAWQIYYGAPNGDINTTVEAYAALRSLGHRDDEPALKKAREWIESKGGLRNVRVFTRYWLALHRRMAVGEDPEPSAGGHLVPALVPVLDLQFRAMGARDADADRRAVGAPSEPAAAAREPAGRAVPRRARGVRLRSAEEGRRWRVGLLLPRRRQGAARPAKCRTQARRGLVARRGHPANARMDRQASGRRRRLGRHPAAVDLQPDGAAHRRLRHRPSGPGQRARSAQRSGLARGRGRGDLHPGHQQPRLGYDAGAARLRRRRVDGGVPQGDRGGGAMAAGPASPGAGGLVA